MANVQERRSSRMFVAAVELLLLASAVAMLWMQPLGDTVSVVLGSLLTIVFIGLLPVLLKGDAGVAKENEMVRREYSEEESPDPYKRR